MFGPIGKSITHFVNYRRFGHFLHRATLSDLHKVKVKSRTAVARQIEGKLHQFSQATNEEVLKRLGTTLDGLSTNACLESLEKYGPNEVLQHQQRHWYVDLLYAYNNPFNILLTFLAVLSYYTEDANATIVIGSMVVLSTGLRFWQEARSNRAAEALRNMVTVTAMVSRFETHCASDEFTSMPPVPFRKEVPIKELVPGDIIYLSAGDMIPADVRILKAKDLFISQSALTGESLPVEKTCETSMYAKHVLDSSNLGFMGTNVVSGSAIAVVVHTGLRTYFGSIAQKIAAKRPPTDFERGINQVSWLLIRFMLVMAPTVFLINGLTKGNWIEAFLFSMSIAIGLTPEMLPMIVTATLAKGALAMSKRKVIVKRLDAIQNFGAMDILCTDKTGTLTQDKIALERHIDASGKENTNVLQYAFLNSFHQTGLKNLLDIAVLEHREIPDREEILTQYSKVDEVPFDFERRRMTVVVYTPEHKHLLICKGAPEEIIANCTSIEEDSRTRTLTPEDREKLSSQVVDLNDDGLRVIAVAIKTLASDPKRAYARQDECELTFVGFMAFLDPPKESAAKAIKALMHLGIQVKILTGDNATIARKVCIAVGLRESKIMLGTDLDELSDDALSKLALESQIFAKLTPSHKDRLVRVMHEAGHVVGFMGDGINDAPALRTADIGISVDSAVDIAKESADIILLEKSLLVLEEGVIEGRKTFANILKYLKMAASSNFGNAFSVLIAAIWLPFLPMLPLQLLVQNLMYDISQIAIPLDNVDKEFLKVPRRWEIPNIGRFMISFGPTSSVFDCATFAILWFVFGACTVTQAPLFQTAWFIEGLITQTLIVHMIRTAKMPILESRSSTALAATTLLVMAGGIILPYTPLGETLRFVFLPPSFYLWLTGIIAGYMLLTQWMKGFFIKHWNWV